MMQAFRTENNYRNASRLSAAELRAAMASREILQSTALAFDTQRQLRFELGGCRAVMPFGQCADGADTGSVRDIAVLTRVSTPTKTDRLSTASPALKPSGCVRPNTSTSSSPATSCPAS